MSSIDSLATLLESKEGEWWDMGLGRTLNGTVYAFKVDDLESGEWNINVRVEGSGLKADVIAIASEGTTWRHNQVKTKTDVFNPGTRGEFVSSFYHPLGIAFVDSVEKRIHYSRPDDVTTIPRAIRDNFRLLPYEMVTKPGRSPFRGKFVVVVSKGEPQKMACLFYLEKIVPVFT